VLNELDVNESGSEHLVSAG